MGYRLLRDLDIGMQLRAIYDNDDFKGEEEEEDSFESGGDDVDEEDEAAEYSSPERRDIHFGVYTPGDSSVRVGPQSTLFRGLSTTLHHAGPQSDLFRGPSTTLHDTGLRAILFGGPGSTLHDVNSQHHYGGTSAHPLLTSQPHSHFGAAYIGASSRPEAPATSSGTSRRSKVSNEEIDDWVVTDDVPGGPCDGSVIPSFLGHTAYQLWNGEPRDYLTMKPEKKSLSRLHGWVLPADQVQAWVWILLASTLFLDRSGGRISASLMNDLYGGIENIEAYSWGSGTLAFLYRQLGIASRAGCTMMAGCMTLLQAWIYEYFPYFQP
ncbi:OLC1v1024352C1 [Oldenlandia corymbosa var. corymbosa]|uniref:OLC1v1024352C1 n=1 Tax=Oldenlandia corymbosa var. corymbosa TaxID=529605 RepID=A0AAV1C2D1_OLDCO|nr:OLC1v1024352C1 [Oldenlandia corymbosa var. corymbosa]